jgi:UTP--glucose-1-phosphate uridylyltransferase
VVKISPLRRNLLILWKDPSKRFGRAVNSHISAKNISLVMGTRSAYAANALIGNIARGSIIIGRSFKMLKDAETAFRREKVWIKAIIPAGGIGTRIRPFTFAVPKELLPINRKPMIQLAVEEALAAGIRDIGIVIRKDKEVIRNYFETLMVASDPLWEDLREDLSHAKLHFVYQKQPLGLGNAIHEAGTFIDDSSFVMIIPDQFVRSKVPATRQLLDAAWEDFQAVWSSLVTVSEDELKFFRRARRFELTNRIGNTWKVEGIREDSEYPNKETLLGFGRTFFPAGVIDFFSDRFLNPATGEVDLLLSFGALIKKYQNCAVLLEGRAMDFGTWAGYEHFFPFIDG